MTTETAILEAFCRNARSLSSLTTLLTQELLEAKPSEDGWPVAVHLAHVQMCRRYWLERASGAEQPGILHLFTPDGDAYRASRDLPEIREQLARSAEAILEWATPAISSGATAGPYDHPALFLQHMIWHEGYHYGLLNLALRLAGAEPSEEWEEKHVWEPWRGPE